MKLPGVGRKTANVVASVAFEVDAVPVDTHVFRVANRIGITKAADTPLKVEKQIRAVVPRSEWSEAHHLLILHGRYTCTARSPKCERCPVRPACLYYRAATGAARSDRGSGRRPAGSISARPPAAISMSRPPRTDRYGMQQIACPVTGSMNVFESKSGKTTRRVPDFRVNN
jgi:endonuclease III